MDGTRVTILKRIDDWMVNKDAKTPNILWLTGAPGAGKSAISISVVKRLKTTELKETKRYAKFFIDRQFEPLRNPRSIWRSVADQLAIAFPRYEADISRVLTDRESEINPQTASVKEQFDHLIKRPFKRQFSNPTPRRSIPSLSLTLLTSASRTPTRLAMIGVNCWRRSPIGKPCLPHASF